MVTESFFRQDKIYLILSGYLNLRNKKMYMLVDMWNPFEVYRIMFLQE